MKKILTMVVVIALVVCAFSAVALADDWTEFAADSSNNSITDLKTATSDEEAELKFKATVKDSESWDATSNILAVGDYIYVGNGAEILKLDKDGNQEAKATLTANMSSFAPYIAYADGTIFAYVNDMTNGYIEAVDAASMQRIWVSEGLAGMNGFSPITISDDNLYVAVSGYDFENYVPTAGFVLGMTISDNDKSSQDEVKANTFTYDAAKAYYWNGVAVSGGVAIVGSQDGVIETIDKATGNMIDTYDAGEAILTSITYVDTKAYFGTSSGLGCITVKADGTIDDTTYSLISLGAKTTTTPVINDGRIYVGTGDFAGGTGLAVIDQATMITAYSAEIPGIDSFSGDSIAVSGIQSTPLLTTAYSETCLYFSINAKPGSVYMVKDTSGQTEADVAEIFTPDAEDQNSTACSFVADSEGTLYYTNDTGYLFAVSNVAATPDTGDGINIVLYVLIGLVVLAVLVLVARKLFVKAK